jgi:hypothetical protein
MKLAVHQPCVRSISDCSKIQLSTEFMARKILTSSTNGRYFERLITLLRSSIHILESKGSKTHPSGTCAWISKDNGKVAQRPREDCWLVW